MGRDMQTRSCIDPLPPLTLSHILQVFLIAACSHHYFDTPTVCSSVLAPLCRFREISQYHDSP